MSKFFKLYAPLYRNIPQTAELFYADHRGIGKGVER